ncbi:MAG: hypothetical protein WEA76_04340 [Acidimicrobiia bacterium]
MAHRSRLSELDRRFGVERDVLEHMLFKLVVIRAMRLVSAEPSDLAEAHRHLESVALGVRLAGRAAFDENVDCTPPQERLEILAETAPEPYRTMFADHLERLTGIAAELVDPSPPRGTPDPLDRLLAEVLCRAVRGAVSGIAAPELASFIRTGMREQPPHGA